MVWTGEELLVWGGATGTTEARVRNDGAAYDPATNAWRVLPVAPISARFEQTAVWTGTEMIIWGGDDDVLNTHTTNDGAAYNPTTNTWRLLPASPLAPRNAAIAVWTGGEMIVLGGQPAVVTDANPNFRDGAAYDPTSNRWHTLATAVPPDHHPLTWAAAVQAGTGRLLAWSQWSMTRQEGPNSVGLYGGVDLFRLDDARNRWSLVPTGANAPPSVEEAIWDGERVLVRGAAYNCGSCPGPFAPEITTQYDPATNVLDAPSGGSSREQPPVVGLDRRRALLAERRGASRTRRPRRHVGVRPRDRPLGSLSPRRPAVALQLHRCGPGKPCSCTATARHRPD